MRARSVITLTTGPAGSGKTYVRCARYLCDEWLPEKSGVHYSNFPVFRDKVAAFVAQKTGKPENELLERIQIIPEAVMATWISGQSGPWDYFHDKNLDGCHIAIDECHNFCGAKTHQKVRARWQAWLGEIRHQGATVEFLSQSPEKVAREIHYEAGLRLSLVNSEDRRDPFLGILLGDWYELKAAFISAEYQTVVWEVERRNVDGKWIEQNKRTFSLDPLYFEFYDSFSRPVQGGEKAQGQQREFQKRTRRGLLWWFFKRNAFAIVPRAMLVGVLVYLCTGGSAPLLNWMVRAFEVAGKNNLPATPAKKADSSIVKPSAVSESEILPQPESPKSKSVGEIKQLPAVPQTSRAEVLAHAEPEKPPKAEPTQEPEQEAPPERVVRVVLIARERIALDDGRIIRVGESCGTLQLLEVDVRRRECILTGGRRVRMGDKIESD